MRWLWLAGVLLLGAFAADRPGEPARAHPQPHSTFRPPRSAFTPDRVLLFAFDNTHLDDLQSIPSLWAFIQAGAFSTNHHTVLPTRSAPGFAAIASGRYADRTGALD